MLQLFKMKPFVSILILLLAIWVVPLEAQSLLVNNNQTPLTTNSASQAPNDAVSIQTVYCPQPSQLIKSGLYWGTVVGGWKSYSESFDQRIASFVGAQWVGINVGKMICIYKGNLAMSFTIPLQNDTLSQVPTGGLWGKDLGGYRNCHSTNVQDCPFVVKTETVNMQQIYRSLDFFKGKPSPLNQNG
jgi:hypothetical protein